MKITGIDVGHLFPSTRERMRQGAAFSIKADDTEHVRPMWFIGGARLQGQLSLLLSAQRSRLQLIIWSAWTADRLASPINDFGKQCTIVLAEPHDGHDTDCV